MAFALGHDRALAHLATERAMYPTLEWQLREARTIAGRCASSGAVRRSVDASDQVDAGRAGDVHRAAEHGVGGSSAAPAGELEHEVDGGEPTPGAYRRARIRDI